MYNNTCKPDKTHQANCNPYFFATFYLVQATSCILDVHSTKVFVRKRLWINEPLALVFLFPTEDNDGIKDIIKSKRERKALKQSRINGIRNVSFSITQKPAT